MKQKKTDKHERIKPRDLVFCVWEEGHESNNAECQ